MIGSGDAAQFAALMRLHNRALFRAARAILRDDAAAEDAVQEAWLRAFRSIDRFRGEAKLSTWLMRIAINEALARRRRTQPPVQEPEELAADAADEPERAASLGELRRMLEASVGTLPAALRSVFVLRAAHDLSVREVAAILHVPEGTVKTRFFRARRRLRLALSATRQPLEA